MQTTLNSSSGRSLREMSLVAREARLVGFERQYQCSACGGEHRSWTRVRACPDCGERLTAAVIHRAAVVSA
jgi:hypothetical protein